MSAPSQRVKVLIVDDSALIRAHLKKQIGSVPYVEIVGLAPDPFVARDILMKESPDLVLLDMEMPRMDGLELVSRIRSQEEFRTTPVVMVTSRAGEKHRKLAREAGADEHVVKPFNDDNLMNLIEQMVTEHRELVGV